MFYAILSAQKKFHPKLFFTQNFFWVKQGATQCYLAFLVFPASPPFLFWQSTKVVEPELILSHVTCNMYTLWLNQSRAIAMRDSMQAVHVPKPRTLHSNCRLLQAPSKTSANRIQRKLHSFSSINISTIPQVEQYSVYKNRRETRDRASNLRRRDKMKTAVLLWVLALLVVCCLGYGDARRDGEGRERGNVGRRRGGRACANCHMCGKVSTLTHIFFFYVGEGQDYCMHHRKVRPVLCCGFHSWSETSKKKNKTRNDRMKVERTKERGPKT